MAPAVPMASRASARISAYKAAHPSRRAATAGEDAVAIFHAPVVAGGGQHLNRAASAEVESAGDLRAVVSPAAAGEGVADGAPCACAGDWVDFGVDTVAAAARVRDGPHDGGGGAGEHYTEIFQVGAEAR